MNSDMTHAGENGCGLVARIFHPVSKLVAALNVGHAIHPVQPISLENSDFVQVYSNRIRVLHVKPENTNYLQKTAHYEAAERRHSTNRNSLTEEYWFTRWNKPLPSNVCICSFRRSQRYSKLYQQVNLKCKRLSDIPPTKISNVETFVERLIQDTLFEAFQEFYVAKNKVVDGGYDNLAFIKSVDDVDGVILRRNKKAVLQVECKPVTLGNNNVKRVSCVHSKKKSENKPLIMLLHGIGSSADAWWNIINSLLSRGFEVIAPDMLGHGYSSAPNKSRSYRFKKLLSHTLAVFDHYALKDEGRKFIVIGHSFGCSLATAVSRYRAQQVVQLVLISGGGPTPLSGPAIGSEISVFGCWQVLISPLLFCGMKRTLFYFTRGKHFMPCDSDNSIPKYVLDYIDKNQNWSEGDAAFHRRILIPTLLVHGLQDTQVTLVQECEMERTIPRAFLELIPTAGHMSLLETPEHLSHMILCFVDWWSR